MCARNAYQVPESFRYAPFYSTGKSFTCNDHYVELEHKVKAEPFYFDMLYLVGEKLTEIPWEQSERSIPIVFKQWKELKSQLQEGFTQRKSSKHNESALIHALSLFIVCLFWTNETHVKGLHVKNMMISDLILKPVNCEERLAFVIDKTTQYHSFVQLQQLFDELEKIFHKGQAIKRMKHEKGITLTE
jgi:hypothetical protein